MILAAAGAAICLLAAGPAQANLIVNGSFELGSYPGGVFATIPSGSTAITGWDVTGASVDWIESYWQPSEGSRSVDLNGIGQGGLEVSTLVSTAIGQVYRLDFDMAGNPDGPPTIKTLNLAVTGSPLAPFTFDTTGVSRASMGWTTKTYFFTATSTTTALSFASGDAGDYGAALDNVRLEAVPEPATLLLLGSGISALAMRRRRKS